MVYDATHIKWFSSSFPHFRSGLVFAVPAPKPLSVIGRLLVPFSFIIWFCLLAMFIIAFAVLVSLRWNAFVQQRTFVVGRKNRSPFINMISICLGGAVVAVPTRNFARTMLIMWLLACVVMRNAYIGAVFTMLKNRSNRKPFNTLDELIKANYPLYMPDSLMYLFDGIPQASKL